MNRYSTKIVVSALLMCVAANSYAWFFFIFPIPNFGNRDPNLICLGTGSKVGDLVRHPNGSLAKVIETYGPDPSTCSNVTYPNKAKVEVIESNKALTDQQQTAPTEPIRSSTNAKIELTDAWRPQELTGTLKQDRNVVSFLFNRSTDIGIVILSYDKKEILDAKGFVRTKTLELENNPNYTNVKASEIEESRINGAVTYQVTLSGVDKKRNLNMKFIRAYYLGDNEIVYLQAASTDYKIDANLDQIKKIFNSVSGLVADPYTKK